jgi:hypothetical protein
MLPGRLLLNFDKVQSSSRLALSLMMYNMLSKIVFFGSFWDFLVLGAARSFDVFWLHLVALRIHRCW